MITILALVVIVYTVLLFVISRYTSRRTDDDTFYRGNRRSPWYIVGFGMIGSSLSGVTFLSEPGMVRDTQFSYMMVVFGYVVGYIVIATVLLPLYYRLRLTSIYAYLEQRFGRCSHTTGASFFLLSRLTGISMRMFITVQVLHQFVFSRWGVSFGVLTTVFVILILLYTFRGGIKTIVWTDTLQTTCMLLSIGLSVWLTGRAMDLSLPEIVSRVRDSDYSTVIVRDWADKRFYIKQFLSGIFIPIVMTGLDQDMMQKNLSCRSLRDAQRNMGLFVVVLVGVNLLLLTLGAVLMLYMQHTGLTVADSDHIFAEVAVNHLGMVAAVVFVIGLIAAAYSSADGTMTAITTSFCLDILRLDAKPLAEHRKINIRYGVHFSVAFISILLILLVKELNNQAIIETFFTVAGYTYGPLLGLYTFGLYAGRKVSDRAVPFIAVLSPVLTFLLDHYSQQIFWGYKFGFELLMVNGLISFIGLWLFSRKK